MITQIQLEKKIGIFHNFSKNEMISKLNVKKIITCQTFF